MPVFKYFDWRKYKNVIMYRINDTVCINNGYDERRKDTWRCLSMINYKPDRRIGRTAFK